MQQAPSTINARKSAYSGHGADTEAREKYAKERNPPKTAEQLNIPQNIANRCAVFVPSLQSYRRRPCAVHTSAAPIPVADPPEMMSALHHEDLDTAKTRLASTSAAYPWIPRNRARRGPSMFTTAGAPKHATVNMAYSTSSMSDASVSP
eukprot:6206947-Pleurochrysis_carterae.AAC.1